MLGIKKFSSLLQSKTFVGIFFLYLLCGLNLHAAAEKLTFAVSLDFIATFEQLAEEFKKSNSDCRCEIKIVSGPSGELLEKIRAGAKYDAFFAADMEGPSRLAEEGLALINSYYVYAEGILTVVGELNLGKAKKIAIANPKLSPYGKAALEYLDTVSYPAITKAKVVELNDVDTAYKQVNEDKVSTAFVPLSFSGHPKNALPVKIVPQHAYVPVRQAAIILKSGAITEAFFAFIKTEKAQELIKSTGYTVDEPGEGE